MVEVSALLPSNALTINGNPAWSVSSPIVTCGSSRRSLENPGSRNPSRRSVSKYKVDTSYNTSDAGPNAACLAHAPPALPATVSVANIGSRRFTVAYEAATTPASLSTRALSSLLVGSMIRASTSCANTSSRPAASSRPRIR